jgi:hypothetical protein
MKRSISCSAVACLVLAVFGVGLSSNAVAVQVWESTFDAGPDGVVDIADNNFAKDMIGTSSGGRLMITTMDNSTDAYTPDKAGRPLELDESEVPVPRTYNDSQSAQYKFRWTSIPTAPEGQEAYHFAGFLGNTTVPQTRQVMGTLMTHWNVGSDYYMRIGLAVMGVGFTDFGYNAGPVINLGSDPLNKDRELRIEFDGSTHIMSVKLLDETATLIASNTRDLDIHDPPPADGDGVWHGWFAYGPTNFQNEVNSISVTHLGWEDYTGWGGDKAWVWEVDSLAWWDEGTVPLPIVEPDSDADYNDDGTVDAADYVVWRKLPDSSGGDPAGYDTWLETFGESVGAGQTAGAVPEPSSAFLYILGATLFAALRPQCQRTIG